MRTSSRRTKFKFLLWGVVACGLVLAGPRFLTNAQLSIVTVAIIFAILAASLDLQVGYAGLPSLGHAVFFGISAYTVGLLSEYYTERVEVILPVSLLTAMLLAGILGPIVLRLRGVYFLMITLAVSQVFWGMAISWRGLTGGEDGITGIRRPDLGLVALATREDFYYFAAFSMIVIVLAMLLLVRSAFGYALMSTRENERRAEALGINVFRIHYMAYIISACIAGYGGALFSYYQRFVAPSAFSVEVSGNALLMVVLGGPGTVIGPVIGAFIIEILRGISSSHTERWLSLLGTLYVLVALFLPRGLAGLQELFPSRWNARGGEIGSRESTDLGESSGDTVAGVEK